jgi:hypothetical protein
MYAYGKCLLTRSALASKEATEYCNTRPWTLALHLLAVEGIVVASVLLPIAGEYPGVPVGIDCCFLISASHARSQSFLLFSFSSQRKRATFRSSAELIGLL